MNTRFHKLNDGWSADPNAPKPEVQWHCNDLRLTFYLNAFEFPEYDKGDVGLILFEDCSRYRIGTLNDEGWYRGQGRFTRSHHRWGEFYHVNGGLHLAAVPNDWVTRRNEVGERMHYLFYFRDEDFECDARGWTLNVIKAK